MTWKSKEETIFSGLTKKFAFFPKRVDDEWVWLENYWQYESLLIPSCIPVVYRWKTREEAEFDIRNSTL